MFEAALGRVEGRRGRIGTGALLSLAAHAIAIGIAFHVSSAAPDARPNEPEVVFQNYAPPPPGPPGPKSALQKPLDKPRPTPRKKDILALAPPTRQPEPPPSDPPPEPEPAEPGGGGGEEGGKEGGVVGGTGTTVPTAAVPPPPLPLSPPPPPPSTSVLFDAQTMTRPALLSGPQPAYTREARAARVEGTVIAQCTISVEGSLRDCRILKGLPFLDDAVLSAFQQQRYKPALYGGRPISVRYVVSVRFTMQ
jgi:periplasmic protein TonB